MHSRAESFLADWYSPLSHERCHPRRGHHRPHVDPPRRDGVSGDIVFYVAKAAAESRIVASRQRHLCCRGRTPRAARTPARPRVTTALRVAGALRGVFRHRPGQHAVSPVAARQGVSEFWRQRLGVAADIGDHRRERKPRRYRIGTASATVVNLEDCSGCLISNWTWADNGYGTGVSGPLPQVCHHRCCRPFASRRARTESRSISWCSRLRRISNTAPGKTNDSTILPESNGSGGGGPRSRSCAGRTCSRSGPRRRSSSGRRASRGRRALSTALAAGPVSDCARGLHFSRIFSDGDPRLLSARSDADGPVSRAPRISTDLRVAGVDPTPNVVDHLRTAPADGTGTIRVLAFGDSGNGSAGQGQMATRIGAATFDLALHVGDIAYSNGTYQQFDSFFFPYYAAWLRQKAIFPTIGNHDDRTSVRDAVSHAVRAPSRRRQRCLSEQRRALLQLRLRPRALHLPSTPRPRS